MTACAAAVLATAGIGGRTDRESTPKTIRIGSVFSVTGIGAPFGPQQVRGERLAARLINLEGGIDGMKLQIIQHNDGSSPQRTPKAMRTLIEREKVVAVLGPTFSNAASTGDPVADKLGAPVLAVSNTGQGIVGRCAYPCKLIFRDSLGEEAAIPAVIDSLLSEARKMKRALIAYPQEDPFGESSASIAEGAFAKGGAAVEELPFSDPSALRSLPGKPSALMITASSGVAAAAAMKAARAGGFTGPILGGNAFNSAIAAAEAGAAGKGARSAAAWYLGNPSHVNKRFVRAYREAYDEAPDQFAAQAYTGVSLLAQAARKAHLSRARSLATARKALAAALAKVTLNTPLGHFRFTAEHDVSQPIWIVAMNGGGGYKLIERRAGS